MLPPLLLVGRSQFNFPLHEKFPQQFRRVFRNPVRGSIKPHVTAVHTMTISTPKFLRAALAALACVFSLSLTASAAESKKSFDIAAGEALPALKQFAAQSGEQLLYSAEAVQGVTTNAVKGSLTPRDALEQMVSGTKLAVVADKKNGALSLVRDPGPNAPRAAPTDSARPDQGRIKDGVVVLDKFEVMGSKLLNMDKPRSRDDAQPYVVFGKAVIEQSGATNLEDFLKNRLTMETTPRSESQDPSSLFGGRSSINLRGLGTNQTLILVDGHRMAGGVANTILVQPDLNSIPLSAIERIEILPATASGIYGGNATGGVVNIILRRDYAGAELKITYSNAFDTDAARRRVDLNTGFTLEGGKTNVLIGASWSDGNQLLSQDRSFEETTRQTIFSRYPDYYIAVRPPISNTTNIASSGGVPLTLKTAYGGGSLGGKYFTYVPVGYAGPASDNGAGLIANAGKLNLALSEGTDAGSRYRALLNPATVESITATVRRQFTPSLQAFVDLGWSENNTTFQSGSLGVSSVNLAASAPGNPFNQAITVTFPQFMGLSLQKSVSLDRRAVVGLIAKLPADWQVGADFGYNSTTITAARSTSSTTFTSLVTAGTMNVFRDLQVFPFDYSPYQPTIFNSQYPLKSDMTDGVIRGSGPLWTLPGGRMTLSALVERREETAHSYSDGVGGTFPERAQSVDSAYTEIEVPLIGATNKIPAVQDLKLQVSVRHDRYTTHGSNNRNNPALAAFATNKVQSTDPTFGARWTVNPDVMLRASYGTGFLAPNITQLVPAPLSLGTLGFLALTDPRRGGASLTSGDWLTGGNGQLEAERSVTKSAGVVLTPRMIPGLRLSVDWIRLSKEDNILPSPDTQLLLNNEAFIPGRVVRGPKLPGDPADWAGPITLIDATAINIARANLEAFDLQLDYHRETKSLGTFDFFAVATKTIHFQTQLFPASALVENVGVTTLAGGAQSLGFSPNYPLSFKGNLGMTWKRERWTAGWTIRYFGSYSLDPVFTRPQAFIIQGNNGRISSQAFHDLFVGYQFGYRSSADAGSSLHKAGAKLLNRLDVQVGVNNVFNKYPVFDVTTLGLANGYSDARLANYYISIKKSF